MICKPRYFGLSRYNELGDTMNIVRFLRMSAHLQLMPVLESGEETLVGGQAVMEGVMMRAPHSYCVAVRKPSGEIVTEEQPIAAHVRKVSVLQDTHSARPGHAGPGDDARLSAR